MVVVGVGWPLVKGALVTDDPGTTGIPVVALGAGPVELLGSRSLVGCVRWMFFFVMERTVRLGLTGR